MAIEIPPDVEEGLDDFERGWIEGVSLYAHWDSGEQYVGTGGRTLRRAVHDFLAERGKEIPLERVPA